MKKVLLISVFIIMAAALSSCAQGITIQAGDTVFEIFEFELTESFGGVVPETEDNTLLTVRMSADESADPSAVTAVFYGDTKCTASSGAENYECKALAFSDENDDTSVWLVFEVPAGSKDTEFTVSGSAFESFSGTAN